ncbi:MAG: hypothetical protein ABUK15_07335 [Anaerolineales bacterium]
MSNVTQPTDFSDLYTDLMNRARADTSGSATIIQAKRYINIALHDMMVGFGEKFPWAEREAILVTQPKYTTGTLVATKGSTTITGTSSLWDTANDFGVKNMRAGGKIVIDGGVEVYTIDSVTTDTGAEMTSAFIKTTTTASTYVYFEDEYALHADFLKPLDITTFDQNSEITLIGRNEFRRRYVRNKIPGKPLVATILDKAFSGDTTPVRKVRFSKPPDEAYSFPYSFVTNKLAVSSAGTEQAQLSADTDEPIVPLMYRHVIVFHALYHFYRDKRDDDRSQAAKGEYTDLILRMTGDMEIGSSKPQFRPKLGSYARSAKRPYSRSGSARYVTGSRFDEMR